MRQSHEVETLPRALVLKRAPGPLRWQQWPEQRSLKNGRRTAGACPRSGRPAANRKQQRRNPSFRRDALLGLGQLCLTSLVYGAAVYGFIVAYLLVLGAMTEPAPFHSMP